jgi:predicted ATP-grasp superfamily ATP-dependent carboligase
MGGSDVDPQSTFLEALEQIYGLTIEEAKLQEPAEELH